MNFIVVFLLSLSIAFAADPCRFEYPGKGVIDLTTLGHTDGTPAFSYPMGMLTVGYSMSMIFYFNSYKIQYFRIYLQSMQTIYWIVS